MPARERRAAEAAHIILYLLLVACSSPDRPSSRSRRSTSRRCCTVWCPDRTCRWPRSSPDPPRRRLLKLVHAYGAWLLPALVALHVAAALRHHYLLHDDVLLRMLPWRTAPGRRDLIGTRDEPARPNPPSDAAVRHRPRLRGEWKADPPRSSIWFSGVQVGSPFSGRFERFEATVDFQSRQAGEGARRRADRSRQREDRRRPARRAAAAEGLVRRWQVAAGALRGDALRRQGQRRLRGHRPLEVRGTTRDAVLPFHLQTVGDQAHAKGHLDLVRTSFGVGQGAWAKGQWVALEIGVDVDLIATRVP